MIKLLEQIHKKSGGPAALTVKGRANAGSSERQIEAINLARLLVEAEEDVAAGRVRPARAFLKEFKNARKIRRQRSMVKT